MVDPLDVALLFLRLLLGVLFVSSGWSHVREPEERGESIGMSPGATRVLGMVEIGAGLSVGLGVGATIGAFVLMGVMLGAIYKKIFVWQSGFWGDDGDGWFYELLYLVCAFVVAAGGGGGLVVWSGL